MADHGIEVLVFDIFGTVVDRRSALLAEYRSLAARKRWSVNGQRFLASWESVRRATFGGLCRCSARATSSLPVPDSPVISTVMLERDSRPMALNTSCMAGAEPMIS